MNNYSFSFISVMVAQQFNELLPGTPAENRVLILSPKDVNTTKAGILIPQQVKEGVPRKGVVVKRGEITEEYKTYRDLTEIGMIVTYGLYAGKEIDFDSLDVDGALKTILDRNSITVLSLNEIIYSEHNQNG